MDEKKKTGTVIASGEGSLWKVEQTVMPKAWIDLLKHFEQFNSEEIAEMMRFFQSLEKTSTRAIKKDGVPRPNALIDAIKVYRKNAGGAELVAYKHEKNNAIKEKIKIAARPMIERNLKHKDIANQINDWGVAKGLGIKFIRDEVKDLCREMNREDLIVGIKTK